MSMCEEKIDRLLMNSCRTCPRPSTQEVISPTSCSNSVPGSTKFQQTWLLNNPNMSLFLYTEVTRVIVSKIVIERASTICTPSTEPQQSACTNQQVNSTTSSQKTNSLEANKEADSQASAAVFGVLTGLLIVILAIVITGWVWTCCTMKKWKNKTQLCTQCQVSTIVYIIIHM